MLTWKQFAVAEPKLAGAAQSLLYEFDIGLGFLATVRKDGGPRVHPICPMFFEGSLYGVLGHDLVLPR